MAKPRSAPTFMEIVGQAREVLGELHALQSDNASWRLSAGAFLEVACRESGLEAAEIPSLLTKLERPGYENAVRCLKGLAGEFASDRRRHHAPGTHPRSFDADARDELAACGLTLRQAVALAAYVATQGGTMDAEAWGGRSPAPSWITDEMERLQGELAALNAEGERALTLSDLHLVYAGDRGDPTFCQVTIAGTAVPALPLVDLVTRLALAVPVEVQMAA